MIYTKTINDTLLNIPLIVHKRISIFTFFDEEPISYNDCFEKWWAISLLQFDRFEDNSSEPKISYICLFSRNKSSKIPNFDELPKELVSFLVDKANASSPTYWLHSNSTINDTARLELKTNRKQAVMFPALLYYNYETKLWESFYTKKTRSVLDSERELIPWYRQRHAQPVYPILDDSIFFLVDTRRRSVEPLPYSSNECSHLSLVDNNNSECKIAHFWCDEQHMIAYKGNSTFDESIAKCKGTSFYGMIHTVWINIPSDMSQYGPDILH